MANEVAKLFSTLGFKIDYSGLKTYENKLRSVQKQINSSSGVTGSLRKAGAEQSDFYKEVTRGYARVKPTLEDHRRNLLRIREGFKQNRLSAQEYSNARMRTLHAISQTEKRIHKERMARIRAEEKAQEGAQRGHGNHRLISALHSDTGLGMMAGGFAAFQSSQSYQQFIAMEQGLTMASGSAEKAQDDLQYLIDLSQKLGISVVDVGRSFSSFSAAAKGTSLTSDEVRSTFEGVAAQARVLNLSTADTQGVMVALTQMMNKGNIMANSLVM